ncbi:unconventional myosin-IXa-like isoform X3 [Arapaima gigas]
MSLHDVGGRRRFEDPEFTLRVYPGSIAEDTIYCPVVARKTTTAAEVIEHLIERLRLDRTKCYVLAEVKEFGGEEWILNPSDCPVQRMMLWPRLALENRLGGEDYRFLLREKNLDGSIHYGNLQMWLRVTEQRRRMVERGFLPPPRPKDHDDLCNLPDLNEKTLLENLRARFKQEKIYTYVGSILVAVNPFKFLPIYNPKYVKMYDNHQLGKLEPHVYAVADVAYHAMLQRRRNQCIVISGESGSGKTQSTNFLIHHLTALSQKGFASGVEQTILGAGPVLEAFGNAKTAHNNNSSRFGKFIQVNYLESGTVWGAYVEKYLLEKSRLVYQEHNERNYHVFYYLLAGASEEERTTFHLKKPEEYHYLNQQDCFAVEGEDLKHDFERLQLAMEMVGFLPATRKQIFSLLSAILHLGNIRYKRKTYRDDSIDIYNPEVLPVVSDLLEVVKEEMLFEALTTRKTVAVGERLIVPYRLAEAGTVRDSMAKSLYSALFDWIVFRINHALLNNRDLEESAKILSIGVLDIFGFEDYENNNFEQFCINFANERLQHYFNQHTFKLEQEEYRAEGISWLNIDYIDNSGCISLISKKPTGLFHLLDEECNFPQATNQTLLDKFKRQHDGNSYIEFPAVMEPAFIIRHYAGKVKYGVKDFREKNTDHMRPDIVALLKSSRSAFIGSLISIDPVATFRWAMLRAYYRAAVAFREAGRRRSEKKSGREDAAPCAVLKSVDTFSFLLHPVHQRSLEILQRCKEEKHNIARKSPRTPLSDLQGANTLNEKSPWGQESTCGTWSGRGTRTGRLTTSAQPLEEGGVMMNSTSSKLLERAQGILMRNKNYKAKPSLPKHLLDVKSVKYLSGLTLHDRITKSLLHLHKKKKPPSISAQFQASLNKLMETLEQSEPYFIKCIRSNADKLPLRFSDGLVLRQLRYTGMLETVRIRQSGYSIKYSHEDFAHHFRVLLPEGTSPTQLSIHEFVCQADLSPGGFQVGKTMVFLREAERQRLQDLLHREVLRRIVVLQRRFRALQERKSFVSMRLAACIIQRWWRVCRQKHAEAEQRSNQRLRQVAALRLQKVWRGYRARRRFQEWRKGALVIQRNWRRWQKRRSRAACTIQTAWCGYKERRRYCRLRGNILLLQAACRGYLTRCRFKDLKVQRLNEKCLNGQLSPTPAKEEVHNIMGLDLSSWEDRLYKERAKKLESLGTSLDSLRQKPEREGDLKDKRHEWVRERSRTLEEPNLKTRTKRENRRMRELEQAKFSLEMLKVRCASKASLSEERQWSADLISKNVPSAQGTQDSESSSTEHYSEDKLGSSAGEEGSTLPEDLSDSSRSQGPPELLSSNELSTSPRMKMENLTLLPRIENHFPIFYVPPKVPPALESECAGKPVKEKKTASRRPVVVVISMQKDALMEDSPVLGPEVQDDLVQIDRSPVPATVQSQSPPSGSSQDELKSPSKTLHTTAAQTASLAVHEASTPAQSLAPLSTPPLHNDQAVPEHQEQLQENCEEQRWQRQQSEQEIMEQICLQKLQLEKERAALVQLQREQLERQRSEALQRIQQSRQTSGPTLSGTLAGAAPQRVNAKDNGPVTCQLPPISNTKEREVNTLGTEPREITPLGTSPKKSHTHTISISMTDRPTNTFYLPRDKVSFSKSDKDLANQERSMALKKDEASSCKPPKGSKGREVVRPGRRKKARVGWTRSDFLSRGSSLEGEGDGESEEDEYDEVPLIHSQSPSPPLPEQDGEGGVEQACHSDSEMSSSFAGEQKKMHKAMSSGDLGKVDSLRKASHTDGRRVRARMRFWGKTKLGEKKGLREKSASVGDPQESDGVDAGLQTGEHPSSLLQSTEMTTERSRESKENKEPSPRARRRRSVKISSVAFDATPWQNDSLHMLTSASDFRSMIDFLMKKINDLESEDSKKDTLVDVVFKKALREFRLNIFNSYSTALAMDDGKSVVRYKDLHALFEHILEKSMRQEKRDWGESPVMSHRRKWALSDSLFSNPFQVQKPERKKRRKKESDIVEEHNGHIFKSTQFNIPTYCEYCSSIIWIMDRACVCKLCRYACHRKCCLKTTTKCSKKYDPELTSRQFGVELSRLTSDERPVPQVVEKLIGYIEMHGLYTEGIYRKSGSTNKIKELKQGLDTDVDSMNLDDYNIHVIASVFKQWLRDLPNPLLTFELYEEFLRAMGLQDKREVVRGVYSVIDQLSRTHLSTLERLIFHLVRIALQEETNRMSANALAIVFAPCILRCPDSIDPLQSVQDISKTTACVELIIGEQMNKYKARLKDITSLEYAENKARGRLALIRRSMGKGRLRRAASHTPSPPLSPRLAARGETLEDSGGDERGLGSDLSEQQQAALQQEERVLAEEIENLQREKEELTFEILSLELRASDDETLESEASIGTVDSFENLHVDSEGADFSGQSSVSARSKRTDGKPRRILRKQADSLDSVDSSASSVSSHHPPATLRLRFRSSSPPQPPVPLQVRAGEAASAVGPEQEAEESQRFSSYTPLSSEKGKQRLKSPPRWCDPSESGGHRAEPDFDSAQSLVLYGSNEFMV